MDWEVSEKNRDTYIYFEQFNYEEKKYSFIDCLILSPLITCVLCCQSRFVLHNNV